MGRKAFSLIVLTFFLLINLLGLTIEEGEGAGTIYIRADGSVEGTRKILRIGDVYTFTGNINDSLVVERESIVVDGGGYILQGTGSEKGVDLSDRNNVTLRYIEVKGFWTGISLVTTSNCTIYQSNITGNEEGIRSSHQSNYNTISGNSIVNNNYGVHLTHSSNNNTVSGNVVIDNNYGVHLTYSSNFNIISDNVIVNNNYSVQLLHDVSSNTISGNEIRNNGRGIEGSDFAEQNKIVDNNIVNNVLGIWLHSRSNRHTISKNMITNNAVGIQLDNVENTTITENNITNNGVGVSPWYLSNRNTFYHNYFINNSVQIQPWNEDLNTMWDDGHLSGGNYWNDYVTKYPNATEIDDSGMWNTPYVIDEYNIDNYPLIRPEIPDYKPYTYIVPDDYPTIGWAIGNASDGDTIFVRGGTYREDVFIEKSLNLIGEGAIIVGGEGLNGTAVLIRRDRVNMTGFTVTQKKYTYSMISKSRVGIHLLHVSHCNVSGNRLTNEYRGIWLWGSSNNIITQNIISSTIRGIYLQSSSNNNSITQNLMRGNYYGISNGGSSYNNITENTIIENRYYGISFGGGSKYNNIVANVITHNDAGITVGESYSTEFNYIIGNTISSNVKMGIAIRHCNNTFIIGNNITNNDKGVWLYWQYYNAKFYHNNLINNTIQVDTFPDHTTTWDNGYPSGGNYWGDYVLKYPNANEIDGTQIWDTPYVIDENNVDYYPLVNGLPTPETETPVAEAGVNQTVDVNGPVYFNASGCSDNVCITSYEWNFDDGTTGQGLLVNHTYLEPGEYTVLLTVWDGAGNSNTDSLTVTVNDVPFTLTVELILIIIAVIAIGVLAAVFLIRRRKAE